jgi:ribA/ribD-fused uncharacterized protein
MSHSAEMQEEDDRSKFYFFWGGPFSQWAHYPMEIEGVTYNTCEQYMMACKARLFGDEESLQAIMAARAPQMQKRLGRKVKNFDQDAWQAEAREIVYRGNLAKFTQHKGLRELLMSTGSKTIVEASPLDFIWGIGMAENDPRAPFPSEWQGKNWLGECIQRVRTHLQEQV